MTRCGLFGIIVASVCCALSWAGNSGPVAVFPDLLSLLAPPVLVFFSLQFVASSPGAMSRATTAQAGRIILGVGAISFGIGHAWMVRLRLPLFGLFTPFFLALVGFLILGWLGVWCASRWRLQRISCSPHGEQPAR